MLGGLIAVMLAQAVGEVATSLPVASPVTDPDWVGKPSGEDIARAYPDAAVRSALAGAATFSCEITDTGTLTTCRVVTENPPAAGFGDASLKLSSLFKMRPIARDGSSTAGRPIRIPVRFVTPYDTLKDLTLIDPALMNATVLLNCRASPQGLVDNCLVIGEQPYGLGAGAIALTVGPKLKVPTTVLARFQIKLILKQGPAAPAR